MTARTLRGLDLVAKTALLLLLLHAVFFPDLPQYHGKGIGARLATYPLSALIVPGLWFAGRRRWRGRPYPYLIDLCAVAPFLLDTLGNALNFYDTITWWDDVMHYLTWIPWVTAFGLAIRYRAHLRRWDVAAITIGFGAVTHIAWELLEYVTFIRTNPNEFSSAYTDTLGDLLLSLCGSVTGGLLVATCLWRLGPGGTGAWAPASMPVIPGDAGPGA